MAKIFMLILDGVSDDPLPELNWQTPLEVAVTPHIEYLAKMAKIGKIKTTYNGYPIESLVCIMGLLGYDPRKYYPCGRASFEALARGIPLGENDLAFRCNIVRTDEKGETISDFTANMISDTNAKKILSQIKLPSPMWELYPGQSYRNLLIVRQPGIGADDIRLYEPHMHQNEQISSILPVARKNTVQSVAFAKAMKKFSMDSYSQIKFINRDEDCLGNMLWFWSPSEKPHFPTFESMHGYKGAVVAGLDFMHGLAMAANMYFEIIPGATGYIDTDYDAKANAAIKLLKKYDFVLTHVNSTDEAAHMRSPSEKIKAIERADKKILGPVFHYLNENYAEGYKIMICGDHKTSCLNGKHLSDPVPSLIYTKPGPPAYANLFSERISCGEVLSIDCLRSLRNVDETG